MEVVVPLIIAAVGFALGYGVREAISRYRHAKARRRSQIALDQGRPPSLTAPTGTSATNHHGPGSDPPVVAD
jgi:hypothetical protein